MISLVSSKCVLSIGGVEVQRTTLGAWLIYSNVEAAMTTGALRKMASGSIDGLFILSN